MLKIRKLSTALVLGMAIGTAAPSVWAAAKDHPDESKQVAADQIPAAVQQTLQRAMPPGSTATEFHRQQWDKDTVYAIDFTTPGGEKLKAHINSDGTLYTGPGLNKGITLAPIAAPAAAPAVAVPAAGGAAQIQQLQQQHAQIQAQITQLNTQIASDEQRYTQLKTKTDAASVAETQRLIQDRQAAATQRDQLTQQMATVDQQLASMGVAAPAAVPAAVVLPGAIEQEAAPGQDASQWKYTRIEQTSVPPAAYQVMAKQLPGMSDVRYRQDVKGTETLYTVHWLSPQNKRYFMTVSPTGQVTTEPRLSIYQPEGTTGGAQPAAVHQGGNSTVGGVTYTTISEKDVDATARSAIDTAFGNKDLKGSTNKVWQKSVQNGKTYYTVRFTHDGKREEARWDANGKLVEGPSPSKE